ncbi:unnamed protein product [Amoebophrya sp. A120]|nr:unnamed protein product [Amoebophrya sp. A120]|eukprot:GSA120T00018024001.1
MKLSLRMRRTRQRNFYDAPQHKVNLTTMRMRSSEVQQFYLGINNTDEGRKGNENMPNFFALDVKINPTSEAIVPL